MALTLSDELVRATGLSEAELRVAIAVALFSDERLTLGQAARLAGVPIAAFMEVLASRDIPLHYGVAELEEDFETMRRTPAR